MKYTDAEISLTVSAEGCLSLRGKYEAHQKLDDNGNVVFAIERNARNEIERNPVFQLKTIQLPKYHECTVGTKLNNRFVQWALSNESKPRTLSAGYWNRMSDRQRLHFHVTKYVSDLYGDAKFNYTILE
jgi:hypothetical protein